VTVFEPDGRSLALADEGTGPAVVLLASEAVGIDDLDPLAGLLTAEDFRVVRLAARPSTDAAPAELAQDVVDVLDHLGVSDAWIGGHAGGGSIARAVALHHHDRVNGVLLLGVESGDTAPMLAEGLPVLVIQGADDDVTPPENGDALQAAAPGLVSVVSIEGAGHRFPATHVGETSWAIEDYLDWD
jgi:pimeloyl-ACP methyl ester carboxylesterase